MKPLIFIPSPRDYPEFLEAAPKLRADKYWGKYHPNEVEIYNTARDKFLDSPEYTHFVILPDDLIVTPEHYDTLCEDIKRFNFKVICGIANIDKQERNQGIYSTCVDILPDAIDAGNLKYVMMNEDQRQKLMKKNPIQRVLWSGFAFMFIRRDVVEMIPFNSVAYSSCCLDTRFCWDCYHAKVPIFSDFRVIGNHLKVQDGIYEYFYVGKKEPYIKLDIISK